MTVSPRSVGGLRHGAAGVLHVADSLEGCVPWDPRLGQQRTRWPWSPLLIFSHQTRALYSMICGFQEFTYGESSIAGPPHASACIALDNRNSLICQGVWTRPESGRGPAGSGIPGSVVLSQLYTAVHGNGLHVCVVTCPPKLSYVFRVNASLAARNSLEFVYFMICTHPTALSSKQNNGHRKPSVFMLLWFHTISKIQRKRRRRECRDDAGCAISPHPFWVLWVQSLFVMGLMMSDTEHWPGSQETCCCCRRQPCMGACICLHGFQCNTHSYILRP